MDVQKLSQGIVSLVDLMARLRGPRGCPWDAKQTDATIKIYLLEEAYEVLEAIERTSPDDVCQELGDLLFQIIFLCQLAMEEGQFDLVDVIERITKKMIHRHPHVFGEARVSGPEEVVANWAKIKQRERGNAGPHSTDLYGVPVALPALLRAHRLIERASKMDLGFPEAQGTWERVEEGIEALRVAVSENEKGRVGERIGDLLFSLVGLSRHRGLNAESLLRSKNQEFIASLVTMEGKRPISASERNAGRPGEDVRHQE